ncbi:YitT family protein [Exiguobacterium sp. SL14]|nr:YitT family protein [Exiguobacterium sp. SL14]MCY1690177.1 YitT family protein [Exiguobacterium sp. SL14]
MLMVVVRQGEITTLKEIVKHIDPSAFLVVSEAHEVLGLGFTDDKRYLMCRNCSKLVKFL